MILFEAADNGGIIGDDLHIVFRGSCFFQTVKEFLRAVAGDIDLLQMRIGTDFFVICVFDPGDIMPVACAVVQAEDRGIVFRKAGHVRKGLIAAGGIFDQDHLQPYAVQIEGLHASEGRTDAGKRIDRLLSWNLQRHYGGYGCSGIIHIVHSGKCDTHFLCFFFSLQVDGAAAGPLLVDGQDGYIGDLPCIAAFRTAEAAQVRVDVMIVYIGIAAGRADAGIGKIDIPLYADRSFETVADDLVRKTHAERGGERIIRVQHQNRCRTVLQAGPDFGSGILHAAVAVHLIREQVGDNDHLRADVGDHKL